ncbi:PaaI family thioesterase [Paraburkholderia acidisoli]|uniref:Hotdog fold thioesterase n=1 Tax=Paraburkholderia acidisoli TaxID=2571748 RepID=A0A7Z2JJK8_9BURK|nr:PaaI family thioesterase [Paraburkholderia acidisoli]QGZ65465.1 hotdog fold thioesterase [Paraburkholderia acidisoli]
MSTTTGTARAPATLTLEQIQQAFDRSPYIASLQLQALDANYDTQTLRVRIPFQPGFERGAASGQWHGGPLAAIIDTVGDFAVGMLVGRGLPTINFRVDYLRPAIDTDLEAVAIVRRLGRSVSVADVELYNDQRALVAIGRASYATA